MRSSRLLMLMGLPALVLACAPTEDLESSGGIAYRIVDDTDALEDAMDRAEDHCDDHNRTAVLQGVSPSGNNELLATFNCATERGSGIAMWVDEDTDDRLVIGDNGNDLDDALARANSYCGDYGRIAVLQSVAEVDGERIAAFDCTER